MEDIVTRLIMFIAAAAILVLPITLAHAQSGIFRQSHNLGVGAQDVDPASSGRFWQVTEKTMSPPGSAGREWRAGAESGDGVVGKRRRDRMDLHVA